jgi:peptidoglycan/xylan/chitin deacetylase (PgdA/CDA1 family)
LRTVAGAAALAVALALAGYGAFAAAEAPANQLWGATVVSGTPGQRRIALTFDDGPNPPYTNQLLDLLRREHVRATFFVVGEAVARQPALARRIVAEGHEIGNHSWDHAHLIALSPDAIRAELVRTAGAIERATGTRPALMRPPFGQRDYAVIGEARALGYAVVMWSEPLAEDWTQPGARVIAQRVLESARDGDIIVLHDGDRGRACAPGSGQRCDRSQDVAAAATVIDGLRARGFRFVSVSDIAGLTHNGGRPAR